MNVISLPTIGFSSNCYLAYDDSGCGVVIDPSAKSSTIISRVNDMGVSIQGILLTHGHFDHMLHLGELREATNAPVYIHSFDAMNLTDSSKSLFLTIYRRDITFKPADCLINDYDILNFGSMSFRVKHTPGHTMGSVLYFIDNYVFTGDTLIKGAIGRTDLPGGNPLAMEETIRYLQSVTGEYLIYPGHGDSTTWFNELKTNPFLLEK